MEPISRRYHGLETSQAVHTPPSSSVPARGSACVCVCLCHFTYISSKTFTVLCVLQFMWLTHIHINLWMCVWCQRPQSQEPLHLWSEAGIFTQSSVCTLVSKNLTAFRLPLHNVSHASFYRANAENIGQIAQIFCHFNFSLCHVAEHVGLFCRPKKNNQYSSSPFLLPKGNSHRNATWVTAGVHLL